MGFSIKESITSIYKYINNSLHTLNIFIRQAALSGTTSNMLLRSFTRLFFCINFINAAQITQYWSDHKLLPPTVGSYNVTSIPSCIHRCTILSSCNMVAVYTSSLNGFICLFAWMECYEKYNDRIVPDKGWDLYALRDKGGLPFVLAYRSSSVKMCTKINQSGYLVMTNDCSQFFCKNAFNQIVHIATRQCLSIRNVHNSGATVALSMTCDEKSVFRETYRAVQQVKTTWHMHPEYSHERPPDGTKVVVWSSGTYWFYFDYKKEFL